MKCLLLRIGPAGEDDLAGGLRAAGATEVEAAIVEGGRDETSAAIDAVLGGRGGRRLVIDAELSGLHVTLHRLMRRGELDTAETAVLLRDPVPFLSGRGLPNDRAGQLRVAIQGRPRLVGVIKDDSGGLCLDHAGLVPWSDADGWWLRAVVDDQRLCDGQARSVSVRRLGPDELEATVRLGRLRKRTLRGRSLQLACDQALVSEDGIDRERPRSKRTFWSEPKLWNMCL
jgi:hypothetical protein